MAETQLQDSAMLLQLLKEALWSAAKPARVLLLGAQQRDGFVASGGDGGPP
jgi:hypothetical protein